MGPQSSSFLFFFLLLASTYVFNITGWKLNCHLSSSIQVLSTAISFSKSTIKRYLHKWKWEVYNFLHFKNKTLRFDLVRLHLKKPTQFWKSILWADQAEINLLIFFKSWVWYYIHRHIGLDHSWMRDWKAKISAQLKQGVSMYCISVLCYT